MLFPFKWCPVFWPCVYKYILNYTFFFYPFFSSSCSLALSSIHWWIFSCDSLDFQLHTWSGFKNFFLEFKLEMCENYLILQWFFFSSCSIFFLKAWKRSLEKYLQLNANSGPPPTPSGKKRTCSSACECRLRLFSQTHLPLLENWHLCSGVSMSAGAVTVASPTAPWGTESLSVLIICHLQVGPSRIPAHLPCVALVRVAETFLVS